MGPETGVPLKNDLGPESEKETGNIDWGNPPPPSGEQTDNITLPHPSDTASNNNVPKYK